MNRSGHVLFLYPSSTTAYTCKGRIQSMRSIGESFFLHSNLFFISVFHEAENKNAYSYSFFKNVLTLNRNDSGFSHRLSTTQEEQDKRWQDLNQRISCGAILCIQDQIIIQKKNHCNKSFFVF